MVLIDPPHGLVPALLARPETTALLVVSTRRYRFKRLSKLFGADEQLSRGDAVVSLIATVGGIPCRAAAVDVIVLATGVPTVGEPIDLLRGLRRMVRPGGAVVVVNQLREGPVGLAGSAVARVSRRGSLPSVTDLSSWMLLAGLRQVKQATVPNAVVPTVVTWATVRDRPWERE